MKHKTLKITLCAALAASCLVAGGMNLTTANAAELASVTIENTGDGFLLGEKTYAAGESFVYTATAHFENGQAAALVFGGKETEDERAYFAFNIDRYENSVKLLYFYETATQNFTAVELLKDYYIGNDKMTDGERGLVGDRVRNIDKVQLKVVVTPSAGGEVYAEFYADNIRRFGVDNEYDLNAFDTLPEDVSYQGGAIGFNCFNAKIRFEDIHYGASDYSYYTEAYRQQYHFSQYAHWNNDPNGLVYYDGWYHMYYQHHPYSNTWGEMYWGHARSRDLAHWELLPICLFPDPESDGWGPGNGYMWSGSAMVYHRGMSATIDARNWFPNGSGEGLIAFYTRDGGMQDQVLMSSDDGGMTWTKRVRIPQTLVYDSGRTDCRDPKLFPVKKDGEKVTLWGMALTGMDKGNVWFLKSEDLVSWSAAGHITAPNNSDPATNYRAECPDLVTLTADDGTVHTVMTFTGREYLVGSLSYDETAGIISLLDLNGNDVAGMAPHEIPFQRMDFGPDSYATQSFFIDDEESEYFGKTVSVNWFSGIPGGVKSIESGMLQSLRKTWNGGGMTIPVIWGLVAKNGGYVLTQTPIVAQSSAFEKTQYVNLTDLTLDETSQNPLSAVASRTLEISAAFDNPNQESIIFKVQMYGDEYTEIGWTKEDGYFVDRRHTSDGGLAMGNYHDRYTSGASNATKQDFYILADNGGVEVFCDGGSYPFYVLTFAAPHSVGASLQVSGEVTVESLKANRISSVWRDESVPTDETVLYVSQDKAELSLQLTTQKTLTAYSTNGGEIEWSIASGSDVVSLTPVAHGATITALKAGKAELLVRCGATQKTVSVTVYGGSIQTDVAFADSGKISGAWLMTENGIVGDQGSGDGFLLSSTTGTNFTYSANFDLGSGAAAALVFRATADMSEYYIANYDNNSKIVKLWTAYGELGRANTGDVDVKSLTLSVTAKGNDIKVSLNGRELIHVTDEHENARTEGLFGLNVCATRATFKGVGLQEDSYTYSSGNLTVRMAIEQAVVALYNDTIGVVEIPTAYYEVRGREIRVFEKYFATLPQTGEYLLRVVGRSSTFTVKVSVTSLPNVANPEDIAVQEGCNASFYIGKTQISSVKVNGSVLSANDYEVKNGVLTVKAGALSLGENNVSINDTWTVIVTVEKIAETKPQGGCKSAVGAMSAAGVAIVLCSAVLARRRKRGNDD